MRLTDLTETSMHHILFQLTLYSSCPTFWTTYLLSDNSVHLYTVVRKTRHFIAELTVFSMTKLYSAMPELI